MLPSPLASAERGEDVGEHRLVPAWDQVSIESGPAPGNGVRTPFRGRLAGAARRGVVGR